MDSPTVAQGRIAIRRRNNPRVLSLALTGYQHSDTFEQDEWQRRKRKKRGVGLGNTSKRGELSSPNRVAWQR